MSHRLLVVSPAAPWAEWTNHDLQPVGQVVTPLDEPGHPCGQWTGRVHWVLATGEDVVLELEWLVAEFQFEPGTKLGFFIGRRHITDLIVKDRATPIIDIAPSRGPMHIVFKDCAEPCGDKRGR